MDDRSENKNAYIVKWLRVLMIVAILKFAVYANYFTPVISNTYNSLIHDGLNFVAAIVLLMMAKVNEGYWKAGLLSGIHLIGYMIFPDAGWLLIIVLSACSVISTFQEFNAHAFIAAQKDIKLAVKWKNLFFWVLVGNIAPLVFFFYIPVDADLSVIYLPDVIINFFYLMYIRKMIGYFGGKEESSAA